MTRAERTAGLFNVRVHSGHLTRTDPMDLDLETADEIAELDRASLEQAGLPVPAAVGPAVLKSLQLQSDSRPVDGLWLAHDHDGRLVGFVTVELPWRDNTDSAFVRGRVHPACRRRGLGRALLDTVLSFTDEAGRTKVYSGAYEATDGIPALQALGFCATNSSAVRRLDVHATPHGLWDRLYDEASASAGEYELVHQVGSTPPERIDDMVALHDAINDAPSDDPEMEDDAWSADRLAAYENAMAGRSQTLYRVMARHRDTGEWAGQSLLCVDEFSPSTAFQEDTSVVRAHRGHRLGLLMKAEMLRWVTTERPEVGAIDTWNATTNHHMIAVNERLGTRMIAHFTSYRLDRT